MLYSKWLCMLLESSHISNPSVPIRAYLMGWDKKMFDDWVTKYPYCTFINLPSDDIPVRTFQKLLIIFYEILNNSFLFIDADTLVLKDISPLLEKLNSCDFLCTTRQGCDDKKKLYAGVMGFSKNKNCLSYILNTLSINWMSDKKFEKWGEQLALYLGLKKSKDINVYSFTEDEHSIQKNVNAIILSSKNMGRGEKGKYEEMKTYFEEWRMEHGHYPKN